MYDNLRADAHDELVTNYAPLVKRIAYHLKARLPATVIIDDLLQAGMIGLLEASRKYDANQGASFETYAGIRIRGAMLDELRRNDWAPKSVHRKVRDITEAIREIENREGRDARDEEVIKALQITRKEYHKTLQNISSHKVISWDDLGVDEEAVRNTLVEHKPGLQEELEHRNFRDKLSEAIASLPERERMIVSLYYDSELNLREIGNVLNVSESRISQLLSQAHIRLRSRMQDWAPQLAQNRA
jgi:RNA polymerase sigma factor for flagellar operon FliA